MSAATLIQESNATADELQSMVKEFKADMKAEDDEYQKSIIYMQFSAIDIK
jgi:hypothetical protein